MYETVSFQCKQCISRRPQGPGPASHAEEQVTSKSVSVYGDTLMTLE